LRLGSAAASAMNNGSVVTLRLGSAAKCETCDSAPPPDVRRGCASPDWLLRNSGSAPGSASGPSFSG